MKQHLINYTVVCLLFLPFSISSQINIRFDIETNKVYRISQKTEKISGLTKYEVKEEEHNIFRPLNVGEYLTFEFQNIHKDPRIDSISARYEFLDMNLRQRDYFTNYFDNQLKVLNGSGGDDKNDDESNKAVSDRQETSSGSRGIASVVDEAEERIGSNLLYPFQATTHWFADTAGGVKEDFEMMLFYHFELGQPTDTIFDEEVELQLIAASRINEAIENEKILPDTIVGYLSAETGIPITYEELVALQLKVQLGIDIGEVEIEGEYSEEVSMDNTSTQDDEGTRLNEIKYHPLQIENRDITIIYMEAFNKKGQKLFDRKYQFHNRWGFKVDFSIGIGVSFLKDHTFVLKPSPMKDTVYFRENFVSTDSIVGLTDQNQIIQQEDGTFFAGVSVLAHFYTRISPRVNLGLTSGLMLNTDSRVNYIFGGSIVFGKEQRLVGTVGMALGKVKRLADVYDKDMLLPSTTTTVQTKDKWERGLYVGLSYNF